MSTNKKNAKVTPCTNACKAKADRTDEAINAIQSAMKRKGLNLTDMYRAVNVLVDCAVEQTILRMHSQGFSIRKVARAVHMDDRRVSEIIKSKPNPGPYKPCESCKTRKCGK